MNNSAIASCMMSTSVGVGTTVTPSTSSSQTAGESKRAFADTPPMVKVRNEQRSYKTDVSEKVSDSDVGSESAVVCEGQSSESPVRQKEQKTEVQDRSEEVSAETAGDSVEAATEATPAGQDETLMTAQGQEPATNPTETVSELASVGAVDTSTKEAADVAPATELSVEAAVVSLDAVPAKAEAVEPASTDAKAMTSTSETPAAAVETMPNTSGKEQQAVSVSVGEASVPATGAVGTEQALSHAGSESADVVLTGQNGLSGSSNAAAPAQETADSAPPVVTEAAPAVQVASEQQISGGTAERDVRQEGTAAATAPQMEVEADSPSRSEGERTSSDDMGKVSSEAQVEIAAAEGQTKSGPSANTSEAAKAESELQIDTHDTQATVSESTSTRSADMANAEGLVGRSPVQNVGDQILESVHASLARGDKQIQVRLDPPELGSVTVRFQEQDGQITGVLEVSKDQTRQEIEQALPQVMRGMQESGILIRRLDVVIADQPEGDWDLDRETLFQDAWAQQGESDQQDTQAGHSPSPQWARWATEQEGPLEQSGSSPIGVAAQDRINILL